MDWKKFFVLLPIFMFFGLILILLVPQRFTSIATLALGLVYLLVYVKWKAADSE